MRKIRIYHPGSLHTHLQSEILLSPEASSHIAMVLRLQVGDNITLFCGDNYEYLANIKEISKKKVIVNIMQATFSNKESPCEIELAQAIPKGDKMDFIIQKAIELGVHHIVPLLTERCLFKLPEERLAKKLAHWQAIIIAACEQCGRNFIPQIVAPMSFAAYLSYAATNAIKFILHPDNAANWRDYTLSPKKVALIIGPEGGITAQEIKLAKAFHFQTLQLGPRILRTETAGLAAISLLQGLIGDL